MDYTKDNKRFAMLSDDDLEDVSGGLQVSVVGGLCTTCDGFVCVWCGHRKVSPNEESHHCERQGGEVFQNICNECEYLFSAAGPTKAVVCVSNNLPGHRQTVLLGKTYNLQ